MFLIDFQIIVYLTLPRVIYIALLILMACVIFSEMFANKRFPLLGVLFTLVDVFLMVSQKLFPDVFDNIMAKIPFNGEYIICGITLITFIITFVIFLVKKRKVSEVNLEITKQVKYIPFNEKMVYFTANKNGTINKINDEFYDLFKKLQPNKNKWMTCVDKIFIDEVEVLPKNFFKCLSANKEYTKVIIILTNGYKIQLPIYCLPIVKEEKITGYMYCNKKEDMSEKAKMMAFNNAKNKLYTYLCLLDLPIAYFDQDKNSYLCSKKLMQLLKIDRPEISLTDFQSRILTDDLSVFKTKIFSNGVNKYYYRLRTTSGYLWFEEKTLRVDDYEFQVVTHKEKNPTFTFKSYTYIEMIKDIDKCFNDGKLFAIMIISFKNIMDINESCKADNTDVLISKFFEKIMKTINSTSLKVYRFGDIEYGILFENYDEYTLLTRGFANNSSSLLTCDVYVNDTRYILKNKVGMVESINMPEPFAEKMIKAALDSLDVASDPEYKNDYCIYYPPKSRRKVFDLLDYNIDLSDQHLDDIYKGEK